MTSNAHDVFLSKVNINIQCETLFPKHKSRVVCIYADWYTYLQDITSLQDWFYIEILV